MLLKINQIMIKNIEGTQYKVYNKNKSRIRVIDSDILAEVAKKRGKGAMAGVIGVVEFIDDTCMVRIPTYNYWTKGIDLIPNLQFIPQPF